MAVKGALNSNYGYATRKASFNFPHIGLGAMYSCQHSYRLRFWTSTEKHPSGLWVKPIPGISNLKKC
jgi:hypothetical protein